MRGGGGGGGHQGAQPPAITVERSFIPIWKLFLWFHLLPLSTAVRNQKSTITTGFIISRKIRMAEEAQTKVQNAIQDMVEDLDRSQLRKMQVIMTHICDQHTWLSHMYVIFAGSHHL